MAVDVYELKRMTHAKMPMTLLLTNLPLLKTKGWLERRKKMGLTESRGAASGDFET